MKPRIKDLWGSDTDAKPRDYDFFQGLGESWEYWEAVRCEECNKVIVAGSAGDIHSVLDYESKCDGYVPTAEGVMI